MLRSVNTDSSQPRTFKVEPSSTDCVVNVEKVVESEGRREQESTSSFDE